MSDHHPLISSAAHPDSACYMAEPPAPSKPRLLLAVVLGVSVSAALFMKLHEATVPLGRPTALAAAHPTAGATSVRPVGAVQPAALATAGSAERHASRALSPAAAPEHDPGLVPGRAPPAPLPSSPPRVGAPAWNSLGLLLGGAVVLGWAVVRRLAARPPRVLDPLVPEAAAGSDTWAMQWSNHINKAQVMGNVGREPKITEFSTGKKTATFSIATTESYMDKKTGQKVEKIMWHQVRVWGWNVGTVERFVHKGTKVYVEGKMSMDEYMDENNVQCQFHYINVSGSQSNILVIQQPQALQYQNAGFMPTPEAYVPNPGYTQGPDPGFNGFNSNYPTQAPVGAPFETGPMPQGGPPPGTWQSSPPDMQAAGGMPGIPANGVAVNDPGMGAFGMPAANGATYPDPNMQTYGMPNLDMPANGMPNPNMQPYGMPNPNMQANGMPNPNMQANGMPNPNMQAYGMPNPNMQANGMPNPDMQANGMPNPNMQVNGAANPNMQANGAPAPPPQGHGSDVTFNFGDAPVETANGASAVPQNAEAAAAPSAGTPEAPAADAAAETAIGGHTDTSAGPTEDGSAAFAGVASAGPEVSENSDDEYNRCGTGA